MVRESKMQLAKLQLKNLANGVLKNSLKNHWNIVKIHKKIAYSKQQIFKEIVSNQCFWCFYFEKLLKTIIFQEMIKILMHITSFLMQVSPFKTKISQDKNKNKKSCVKWPRG